MGVPPLLVRDIAYQKWKDWLRAPGTNGVQRLFNSQVKAGVAAAWRSVSRKWMVGFPWARLTFRALLFSFGSQEETQGGSADRCSRRHHFERFFAGIFRCRSVSGVDS